MIPSYLERSPLLAALSSRRSRRFARGLTMPPRGALSYRSRQPPQPLDEAEEALLAFAACGITGYALADLPLGEGEGGNIMLTLLGRTVASGDAAQSVAVVVINDEGAQLIRRPRELPSADFPALVRLAEGGDYVELYRRSRIRVADERREPPRRPLFNIGVNDWVAGAPGTTTFLPINDLSYLYINGLLELFNEETACFVLDDRAGFRPAGLQRFARSKGGHLDDDPTHERVATVQRVELIITDVIAVEQGMMHQNLALMCEAMGLGGFPSFAEHEYGWFEALDFTMGSMSATRYLGGRSPLGATRATRRQGRAGPLSDRPRARWGSAAARDEPALVLVDGRGGALRRRSEDRAARLLPGAGRRYGLARRRRGRRVATAGLGPRGRRDHRLLRVSMGPLRSLPGQHGAVPDGASVPSRASG